MKRSEAVLLLLCCALGEPVKPLTQAEYRRLAQRLAHRPSDPRGMLTAQHLRTVGYEEEEAARILLLLERTDCLRRYLSAQPDITVLTRISEGFPARLRRLENECPPALFCKGDASLLTRRCVSLVGSRALLARNRAFAERIGELTAREGFVLVSGGAAGADSAAQTACLRAGGSVICFVPDALRRYPERERVLYCADEGYEYPFTTARALRRNHYIHALGEKSFVAQCEAHLGGSWSGAADNLRRGLSELYVLDDGSDGTRELIAMGANRAPDALPSIANLRPAQLSIFD